MSEQEEEQSLDHVGENKQRTSGVESMQMRRNGECGSEMVKVGKMWVLTKKTLFFLKKKIDGA